MSHFKSLALAATLAACTFATQSAPIAGQGTWQTTLLARDLSGNAVALNSASAAFFYDSTMNVTWLANMNLNGTMNWAVANAWANGLTTGGFTDWRLPNVIDSGAPGCQSSLDGGTDCGYNVQTQVGNAYSELAHLYYVTLGNLAPCAPGGTTPLTCEGQPGSGLTNTAYFQDMRPAIYWSGTASVVPGTSSAWYFYNFVGAQNIQNASFASFAVAVRTGDVLAAGGGGGNVPEPHGLLLGLTALAALVTSRPRRAA
jgi:hypothetical protein